MPAPVSRPILPARLGALLPFALLHHTGHGPPHYDLLLQVPSQENLLTWRLSAPPQSTPPPIATRIHDHRPLYLTYEGPISNNRGQVQRISHGAAALLDQSPTTLHLHLPSNPPCEITLPL